MEFHFLEGVFKHQQHCLAHEPLSCKIGKYVVTKESAPKVSQNDVVDIDNPNELTGLFQNDKKSAMSGS